MLKTQLSFKDLKLLSWVLDLLLKTCKKIELHRASFVPPIAYLETDEATMYAAEPIETTRATSAKKQAFFTFDVTVATF
jgi:hypothetical protein